MLESYETIFALIGLKELWIHSLSNNCDTFLGGSRGLEKPNEKEKKVQTRE